MNTTSNSYQSYIDSVFQLAQTMVIKSAESALLINQKITEDFGAGAVDTTDPGTWKYYLNLSGEYHPTDTMMTVVSLDNLETINFTKEVLVNHPATVKGYDLGTHEYNELLLRYPTQFSLIRGILYPCDIDKAIQADNWAILAYDLALVEINEYHLISRMQEWIDGYRDRWINPQFQLTDSLYLATMYGVMCAYLVPAILSYRLEACKTNEAHSFHVRQYLGSHNGLDVYMDQLTTKQALWLYRNIVYIEANIGKTDTFNLLVEHIMTERNLPLGAYTMRHDVSNMPADTYPTVIFQKSPINVGLNDDNQTVFSLQDILDKEALMARSNVQVEPESIPVMQQEMRNSLASVVGTKLLESSVVDRSNNTPWTLNDILLHEWLFLASKGVYTAFVTITDPVTGERIPLSVKDAYAFLWYSFAMSIGIQLTTIPQVMATRVQRMPTPSVADLMSVVDSSIVNASVAADVLSVQPTIGPIISTEAFYTTCQGIYNAAQYQRRVISNQERSMARGMTFNMVERIYCDTLCNVADPGSDYVSWFAERNIVIANYTVANFQALYTSIIKDATGMSLNTTNSLKNLQAAMVGIMSQLSSYSVQYNTEINATDIMVADWTAIRVDNFDSTLKDKISDTDIAVGVVDTQSMLHDLDKLDVNTFVMTPVTSALNAKIDFRLPELFPPGSVKYRAELVLNSAVRIRPYPPLQTNNKGVIPVMGTDAYLLLPYEDQIDVIDAYGSQVGIPPAVVVPPATLPPLSQGIPNNVLNGLVYDNTYPPAHVDLTKAITTRQLDGFDHT